MGADIKALKTRIRGVDSTLHLTRAMGLVASSKMRRANLDMHHSREYADAFDAVVSLLSVCPECAKSSYLSPRPGEKTKLIVIAGDRGLAGGYNTNAFRLAATLPNADILPIGKRACDRYGEAFRSSERFSSAEASALAKSLCREFLEGQFDRLGILFTRYISMLRQEASLSWLLPIPRPIDRPNISVLFEPDALQVLDSTIPEYIAGKLIHALRESFASEIAARRMAMDSAGKNAQIMIDELQLKYNRARQNAITQEITEIIAGSSV